MQTVVTAYYGIILDDTVNLLNEFEKGNVKSRDLWTSMIHSLEKSFRYDLDQDGTSLSVDLISAYWSSPSRFDKIIRPLLSQLTLPFKSVVVVPAIVAFASKTRSEENFKVINTQLMEYMKSESASIRLAAINTQRELYLELSGEWLKMLPPTVPAISEALEDEDDNVIEATHQLIATIEKVGGISIQKLLTS
jgi:U3 small nucleolar RNA-associated protein 10